MYVYIHSIFTIKIPIYNIQYTYILHILYTVFMYVYLYIYSNASQAGDAPRGPFVVPAVVPAVVPVVVPVVVLP